MTSIELDVNWTTSWNKVKLWSSLLKSQNWVEIELQFYKNSFISKHEACLLGWMLFSLLSLNDLWSENNMKVNDMN